MKYSVFLLLGLIGCFAIQAGALHSFGGRPAKNESNYFSSLGRIQSGATGDPEVMFLGSSLTGRLPDRASGFPGVANMGCDGGSAIDALRAMDRGDLPVAPVVMVELNTMVRALDPKVSEVGQAIGSFWFQLGVDFPPVSAYARPSGFFYSPLLALRTGSASGSASSGDLGEVGMPSPAVMPPDGSWSGAEQELIDEVSEIVRKLDRRGVRVIFYWIPPGRPDDSPVPGWLVAMAASSGSEFWDLGGAADPSLIQLTDGAHMAAPSAARTVRSVLNALESPGQGS